MFQYYLPGTTYADISRETIASRGLAVVFRDLLVSNSAFDSGITKRQVHNCGPDDGHGVIVAVSQGSLPGPVGYFKGLQGWSDRGGYWIGSDTDRPHSPSHFQRPHGSGFTPGVSLLLGDGNYWEVPTIRQAGRSPMLPQRMGIDASGQFSMSVLSEYDFAWHASGAIFDLVFGDPRVSWEKAFGLCVQVLSLNYRVSEFEVSRLGLITTENFQDIFKAAIDWQKIVELTGQGSPANDDQKKTESVASRANTCHGSGAD